MIGLAAVTADTAGDMVINELPDSEVRNVPVRVSRSATLDGGVVIDHQGACHGDRTFELQAEVDEEEADLILHIATTHTRVRVTTPEGAFLGAIAQCRVDNGQLRLTIYIEEKTSA